MNPMLRRIAPLALAAAAAWLGMALLHSFSHERIARELASSAKAGDITMISSVTCPHCLSARTYFKEHGVVFDECFIENDASCAATYSMLSLPGTPVLIVRGERQLGFSAERVAQRLRQG